MASSALSHEAPIYTLLLASGTLYPFECVLPSPMIIFSCLQGRQESCLTVARYSCGSPVALIGT